MLHAGFDLRDDLQRILAARVVGGDDRIIRKPADDGAHDRALRGVAIAARAEHRDQPAAALRRGRPQRLQHLLERVGRVRIVDHHERFFADLLHATRNRR